MLDHVTIGVRDIERSKIFYDTILRSIGIERLYAEGDSFAGYGTERKAFFWIGHRDAGKRARISLLPPQTGKPSMSSIEWGSSPAAPITVLPVCAPITIRTITVLSFSTLMGTISKRFVTWR